MLGAPTGTGWVSHSHWARRSFAAIGLVSFLGCSSGAGLVAQPSKAGSTCPAGATIVDAAEPYCRGVSIGRYSEKGHRIGEWLILHPDHSPKARGRYSQGGNRLGWWQEWPAKGGTRHERFYYASVIVCVHNGAQTGVGDIFVGLSHGRGAEVMKAEPGGFAFFFGIPAGRLDVRISAAANPSTYRADATTEAVNLYVLIDAPSINATSEESRCPSYANIRGKDSSVRATRSNSADLERDTKN